MVKLTYHGHSVFEIKTEEHSLIIDPFLNGNSNAKIKPKDVKADYIILTHAHGDHLGDAFEIAKNNNATIIAVNELANYAAENGCKAHNMHIGGGFNFPFGRVKFTIAHHGSSSPDGRYMGEPAGVVISVNGKNIYHAGDTERIPEMKDLKNITVALLPCGGTYTMDFEESCSAALDIKPEILVPMHNLCISHA